MSILYSISLKKKFIIALLPLLLALLWFTSNSILEKRHIELEMESLTGLTQLAKGAGNVAHELQRERGMSSGYLGSQGKRFANELREQRPQTDKALAELESILKKTDSKSLSAAMTELLQDYHQQQQQLAQIRTQIDALTLPVARTLAFYSATIADMINLVGVMGDVISNGDLVQRISSYFSLLSVKEQTGIERAILTNVFAADRFAPGQFEQFSLLVGKEIAFTSTFLIFAENKSKKLFNQLMSSDEAMQSAKLRDIAFSHASTGNFGVDANVWFKQQTVRIDLLKKVEDLVADDILQRAQQLAERARIAGYTFFIYVLVALALATLFAVVIMRSIHRQLTQSLRTINEMEGDLTCRLVVHGSDELSQLNLAYNHAIENIETIVSGIKRGVTVVTGASREIATSNQDLVQRTNEQAASIVEAAGNMNQVTTAIKQTANYAEQAHHLTQNVGVQVHKAGDISKQASVAMHTISISSDQMVQITGSIDDIAFQTNLLALNASVEAARAGEQGRGFAVVAAEVRKLAQRCANESQQIRQLINNNVENIRQGAALVDSSREALNAITSGTDQVLSFVSDISSAANSQSQRIEQIHVALNQLEKVTQQNVSLIEHAANSSQKLDQQTDEMKLIVDRFTVEA